MSEELGAVLEAPEVIADDVVDQGLDGTPDDVVDPAAVSDAKEEVAGDWRKVPAELKEFFKTPAGKAAKDAWFERNAYKEKFPEGIKQVNELTAFLDEHGGREGLTTALGELQGKAAELDAISQKIETGDASLVNDLTPETLSKLAPVVAERWAKDDPEGWGAAMSGVFAATIRENQIPIFLERMGLMLEMGKTDTLPAMVKQLQEWAGSFQAKAQAPRTTPLNQPKSDGKPSVKEERETWESEKFSGTVTDSIRSFRESTITKEISSYIARKPGDSIAKELALNAIGNKVHEILGKDQKFQDALNNFTARRDKAGYMKLLESREGALIQKLAPDIARSIFGNPAAPKTEVAKPAVRTPAPRIEAKIDPRDAIFNRILSR